MDGGRKTRISAFHPWMKSEKREKERFRPGGKPKTAKNCISATAENQKQIKMASPLRRKSQKWGKMQSLHGRSSQADGSPAMLVIGQTRRGSKQILQVRNWTPKMFL